MNKRSTNSTNFHLPKFPTLAYISFTSLLVFGLAFFISYGNNQKQDSNADSSTISITASPSLTMDLETTPAGNSTTISDNVTVTSNQDGHKLFISAATSDNRLTLDGSATASKYLMPTIKGKTLAMNSWGYTLDNQQAITSNQATYNAPPPSHIPTMLSNVTEADVTNNGSATFTTPITFAIKANTSLPSGTYKNSIVYTAVSNHIAIPTFGGITTMQQMTSQICQDETQPSPSATNTTTEHSDDNNLVPEATLTDTRDGKTYVVRKLADGNCWMSQNLALSTTNGQVLTSADTDLNNGRTFTAPGPKTEGSSWNNNGTNGPHYLKPKPNFAYIQNGTTPASTPSSPDKANIESAGNYYDWPMATAGARKSNGSSLISATSGQAADSICPKGWRLPPNEGNKSYTNLSNSYGTWDINSDANLLIPPFNFVRAGYYNPRPSSAINFNVSILSSATVRNRENVYVHLSRASSVNPANYRDKGFAFSVRCVSR